jgi:DNA-binding transcriptional MerR regulator
MAWSTREVAELAGTTLKTVRHYHQIGLLELPDRSTNGYKQYEVGHLVRLLRITRLTDLGVPLSQIATMGHDAAEPEKALRVVDAELASSIERLQRVRGELGSIFRNQSSTDMPPGFRPLSVELSTADRALILVYSRVYGPAEMDGIRETLVELSTDPTHGQFNRLAADAGEDVRRSLAARYARILGSITSRYSWMRDPDSRAPEGAAFARCVVGQAISDLYNPAQLDVLQRVHQMARPHASDNVDPAPVTGDLKDR